jgi:hypothetical protein
MAQPLLGGDDRVPEVDHALGLGAHGTGRAPQLGLHGLLELLPHARDGEEDGGPAGTHVLRKGGEAPGEPRLSPGQDLAEVAGAPLGDVRQRQEREEPVGGPHAHHAGERPDGLGHVLVRDHRAFGRPGRAARVDDGGDRVGTEGARPVVEEPRLLLEPLPAERAQVVEREHQVVVQPVRRLPQHDHPLERGQPRTPEQQLRELVAVPDEAHPAFGVSQDVGHLAGRARRVGRDGDGPGGEDADVGHVPAGLVGGEDADAVAALDPERHQTGGHLAHRRPVLGPRHGPPLALVHVPERRAFRPAGRAIEEEVDERPAGLKRGRRLGACPSSEHLCTHRGSRHGHGGLPSFPEITSDRTAGECTR